MQDYTSFTIIGTIESLSWLEAKDGKQASFEVVVQSTLVGSNGKEFVHQLPIRFSYAQAETASKVLQQGMRICAVGTVSGRSYNSKIYVSLIGKGFSIVSRDSNVQQEDAYQPQQKHSRQSRQPQDAQYTPPPEPVLSQSQIEVADEDVPF